MINVGEGGCLAICGSNLFGDAVELKLFKLTWEHCLSFSVLLHGSFSAFIVKLLGHSFVGKFTKF